MRISRFGASTYPECLPESLDTFRIVVSPIDVRAGVTSQVVP